jgi:hypothetical protein
MALKVAKKMSRLDAIEAKRELRRAKARLEAEIDSVDIQLANMSYMNPRYDPLLEKLQALGNDLAKFNT